MLDIILGLVLILFCMFLGMINSNDSGKGDK